MLSKDNEEYQNKELAVYVANRKQRLNSILEHFRWNKDDIEKAFNTNSPSQKVQKDDLFEEEKLPPSCATTNSITLNRDELRKLIKNNVIEIPQTFADLQLNFTCEEKLKIYEYVKKNTKKTINPLSDDPSVENGEFSFAEIVAFAKREKKNRRRHRVSKPSYTEEIRALVQLQMDALIKLSDESKNKTIKREAVLQLSEKDKKDCSGKEYKRYSHESRKTNEQKLNYKSSSRRRHSRSRSKSPKTKKCKTSSYGNQNSNEQISNHNGSSRKRYSRSCSKSPKDNKCKKRRSRSSSRYIRSKKRISRSPSKSTRRKEKRSRSSSKTSSRRNHKRQKSRSRSRNYNKNKMK